MEDALSMGLFALILSVSPGPVNLLALATGLRHGPHRAMPFVFGATSGFVALLLGIGLAAGAAPALPEALSGLQALLGASVIAYFGVRLATAPAHLDARDRALPTALQGAVLQWLNPKAWAACLAAVSLFDLSGDPVRLGNFSAVYFLLCFAGIASWAMAGRAIRRRLDNPKHMRLFNIALGTILGILAAGLCLDALLGG